MKHSAKFAFFYALSLISLVFVTTSVGTIVFQLINKFIEEITFHSSYSLPAVRFALASLLVAAPVYFFSVWRINLNISKNNLPLESGIRKWLSYFILLVSSVVLLGYLIGVFYSFLDGELTTRFLLKALTVFVIAGFVIWYYLHDILRSSVKVDKTIKSLFWVGVLVSIVSFGFGLSFIESPTTTRLKREDGVIANNLSSVENGINRYYEDNDVLPSKLDNLLDESNIYLIEDNLINPVTKEKFSYRVISADKFELCTTFNLSNKEKSSEESSAYLYRGDFIHDEGENCFERTINDGSVKIFNSLGR